MCKDGREWVEACWGNEENLSTHVGQWEEGEGRESKERWRQEQFLAFMVNKFSCQNSC